MNWHVCGLVILFRPQVIESMNDIDNRPLRWCFSSTTYIIKSFHKNVWKVSIRTFMLISWITLRHTAGNFSMKLKRRLVAKSCGVRLSCYYDILGGGGGGGVGLPAFVCFPQDLIQKFHLVLKEHDLWKPVGLGFIRTINVIFSISMFCQGLTWVQLWRRSAIHTSF